MSYANNPKIKKYKKLINGQWSDSNWWKGTHKMKDTGLNDGTLEAVKRDKSPQGDLGSIDQAAMSALSVANSFVQAGEAGREEGEPVSTGAAIMQGATTGASLGAVAGPWGSLIGAGAGAVASGVNNHFEEEHWERKVARKKALENREEDIYGKGFIKAQKAEAFNRYVG